MKIDSNRILLNIARLAISKTEFSKRAGIKAETLSSILRRGVCRIETVGKIAAALGVPVEEIILTEEE